MSSATSTDASTFRPWHFFVLGALAAATAGVFMSRSTTPAALIFMSLAIGASGAAALALYWTLWPLAGEEGQVRSVPGGRSRAGLEREKMLALRAIKDLEFDHAMGKMSDEDFHEMASRLRARALGLMRQLDDVGGGYQELVDREVKARLAARKQDGGGVRRTAQVPRPADTPVPAPSIGHDGTSDLEGGAGPVCAACGTENQSDARFCKACGVHLGRPEGESQ